MKKFAIINFVKEKNVGVAPCDWLERACDVDDTVIVNWEEGKKKSPYEVVVLGFSDDREDAESMMDRYIETGRLTEKRKLSAGFHDLSDSSDDELLKEKQKRMRISYAAGQKKMKEKFLEIKGKEDRQQTDESSTGQEKKQQEIEDNTQNEKEQEKESPSEMTDTQEARSSDEDEQVGKIDEQKKSGATEDEKTKDDANKENEQTIFKIKKVIHTETPVRMKKVVPSEDNISSRLLKKSRIDRKSSWLRNLEEVVSSEDEEDLRLSKEELMTKCQMQAFELQKKSKEIRRLSQENENLRAALGLAKELPDLLQKVRRLKSSPSSTPSPSTKPSTTPKSISPTLGRRAPLQAITPPVAPENENGEEVIQFGSACISSKRLRTNVGSRYSHLVNFIMEEIFTEEEMAECSLTGSKGRTKTEDIKPALDADKLADIISYTKTQWKVSDEEIKKTVRMKLNNCHKKMYLARKTNTPEDS